MLELASRLVLEVALARSPGGPAHTERLFLEKRRGESMAHVAMKLLAWAAHFEPEPAAPLLVEADAGQHYKPDVVRFAADGKPALWIDCGRTAPKKLAEVVQRNRGARVVIVKRLARELSSYRAAALPRLVRDGLAPRVGWLAFDDGFVDALAERLWARHEVALEVAPDRIAVTVDGGPRSESALGWLPSGDEPHNVRGPRVVGKAR